MDLRKLVVATVRWKRLALIFVVVVAVAGGVIGAYAFPQLKSIFAPYPGRLYPPPAEYELIDVYFNQTGEARALYFYSGTIEARKLEIKIDSFSKELNLLTLNNKTIVAPYSWQVTYGKVEGRPAGFRFWIIAPNKPGEYEVNLRFIVSNSWLSSREYLQKLRVRVLPMPLKPKPEEILTITLDKEIYGEGDTMTITIQNISNETIWFINAMYNLVFERFDHAFSDWVFHAAPIAAQVMTPLQPGEGAQVTWKLDAETFPSGLYRIVILGVYAEFNVIEVQLSKAELETIVIGFLKTTDVADGGWDGTVEIKEIYDHKLGGKVVVVEYTTANAIHPHFAAEAIEHHTAVITIDENREVVSAFCIWGSFHDSKVWDLINQK